MDPLPRSCGINADRCTPPKFYVCVAAGSADIRPPDRC